MYFLRVVFPTLSQWPPCTILARLTQRQLWTSSDRYALTEVFYRNEVLHTSGGIEEIGEVQWDLFICLIVAWALVYGFIWKGLHNSGKVRSVT